MHAFGQKTEINSKTVSSCQFNCPLVDSLFSEEISEIGYQIQIGGIFNCIVDDKSKMEFFYSNDSLFITIQEWRDYPPQKKIEVTDTVIIVGRGTAVCDCYYYIDLMIEGLSKKPDYLIVNDKIFFRRIN